MKRKYAHKQAKLHTTLIWLNSCKNAGQMWPSKFKIWKPHKGGQHTYIDTQHHSTNSCILGNKRPPCWHNFLLTTLPQGTKTQTHKHFHIVHKEAYDLLWEWSISTHPEYSQPPTPPRGIQWRNRIIFSPTSINRKYPNILLSLIQSHYLTLTQN